MDKKKYDAQRYLLYAVTDRSWLNGQRLEDQVEQAILGGVTCVQLRDKTLSPKEFYAEAVQVKQVTDCYGVPLIINDHVEIAAQIGAAGVHIGQSDMNLREARAMLGPDRIIGVSARTVEQALSAQLGGANYLGVGAVFGTTTKLDAKPLDFAALQAICQAVEIPVVAIGGVNAENLSKLKGSGIAGAAIVSALFAQPDITAAAQILREKLEWVTA
jgi:thiamine-phosphate pyrophosphorylase